MGHLEHDGFHLRCSWRCLRRSGKTTRRAILRKSVTAPYAHRSLVLEVPNVHILQDGGRNDLTKSSLGCDNLDGKKSKTWYC